MKVFEEEECLVRNYEISLDGKGLAKAELVLFLKIFLKVFEEEDCEVRNCEISLDRMELAKADLVLFKTPTFKAPTLRKPKGQVDI